MTQGEPAQRPASNVARPRFTSLLTAAILGGGCTLLAILAFQLLTRGRPLGRLTRQDLDAARQRWKQTGPDSYDIEVRVQGPQAATYQVQVRQGVVHTAQRDGRPLTQRRTFSTWSVPGMFSTIETDLLHVEKVAAGKAERQTPQLALRGQFDPQYGYPRRYHRIERVKWGANPEISWEVVRFQTVP